MSAKRIEVGGCAPPVVVEDPSAFDAPALTWVEREQIALTAQKQAEAMADALEDVDWREDAEFAREAFAPDVREWRGIAKACQREAARCAALKHPTS